MIFRELQRRSPGRYQPLKICTREMRHAEDPSPPVSETLEEQQKEEVIQGSSADPLSSAVRAVSNS